jgi:multiple sugar transport system permease protein
MVALNQETINYINYYLSIDMELVQNEDTIAKIDQVKKDLSELELFIAEEIASSDLRTIVQVGEAEQNTLVERQQSIVNKLSELYEMDDDFYSPEDTMAVASEFETSIIKSNFSGGDNFIKVLKDERVHSTLTFTLVFTLISVFAELIFGLALALIMNKPFKGRSIVRTFSLIPWAIPTSVAALIWSYLYNGSSGIVSNIFTGIGLINSPASMLNSAQNALDGARSWQQFRYITLPLLKPSIFVALLFRTLDAFRILDLIYVLTE